MTATRCTARWIWVALAAVLVTLGGASWILLQRNLNDELSMTRQSVARELGAITAFLSNALQEKRPQDIARFLPAWGEANPIVAQLQLRAANGIVLADYKRATASSRPETDARYRLDLESPIVYSSRGHATLHARIDLTPIYRNHRRVLAEIAAIFSILTLLLTALLYIALRRQRDSLQLRQASAEIDTVNRAVARSEERLRLALDAGQMGIFDWDLARGDIVWSEEHARLFGMKLQDFDGRYQTFARRVHPDDLARIQTAVEAARVDRGTYYGEYRIVWPDGAIHWVAGQGKFFYGEDGSALRMTGVVRNIDAHKRTAALLSGDKKVLELIAEGAPLGAILDTLTRNIEDVAGDTLCSILLLDADGARLHHGSAPSLPREFIRGIDGNVVGPHAGSCGTAAYRNQTVIVSDIAADPLWADYRALALRHGLRACWSTPIRSISNRVLGTFALYYREPRSPTSLDFELIEGAVHLAGIAIGRKRAETALRESEERFRAMFEHAAVGMALVAPQGRALKVNNKLCEILGYPPAELLTLTFKDIALPEDLDTDIDYMRRLLSGDIASYTIEKRYMRKDASIIWVHLTVALVRAADGAAKYFISVVEDISARKQAELMLQQEAIRRRILFEQAKDGIFILDRTGMVIEANASFAEMLGYAPDRVLGLHPWDWDVVFSTPEKIQAAWPEIPTRSETFETRIRRQDGSVFDAEITSNPAQWEGQTLLFHVCRDITQRKQAERALHRLTEELEQRVAARTAELVETNAELETFSYTVSHDLRAPLRAVQGLARALQEDYADKLVGTGQEYTERLVLAAERMDGLIQDLLAYSRLTHAALRPETVDLNAIVDHAREQLALDIVKSGAVLNVCRPLATVTAHTATLTQVVTNLLSNAIKFIAPGVQPIVTVRSEPCGSFVRVWFEDNGIGIDAEYGERIFRVFERLHGIESYPGSGIGLAIVRKGVERMGGHVGVHSATGQGSRFWIELPRRAGE